MSAEKRDSLKRPAKEAASWEHNSTSYEQVASPDAEQSTAALAPYDPMQAYLREIRRYDVLTREEERELAVKVRESNDREAAFRLITCNLRLVVKIAMSFYGYLTNRLLDLIQQGNIGLLHSIRKYDPYRGIRFSSYASFWIRAYILKFIMENWRLVKIGTTQEQRKLFYNLFREREKLLAQGYAPETRLLAGRLNVTEEEVIHMSQRLGKREVALDSPINEDSSETRVSQLPDRGSNIEDTLSRMEQMEILRKQLRQFRSTLSGKAADIYDNRMLPEKGLTLQELGDRYHVSRERIRQIEEKTKKDLKKWLQKTLPDFEDEYANLIG